MAGVVIQFLVLQGRPPGKRLNFPPGDYLFGRGGECHVRPNSDWVSRQHCLLRVTPDAAYLNDLGSRNGTLVNGIRVRGEQPLAQGDLVQVGPLVFEVCLTRPGSGEPPAVADVPTLAVELGGPGTPRERPAWVDPTAQQPAFPPDDQTQQKPD